MDAKNRPYFAGNTIHNSERGGLRVKNGRLLTRKRIGDIWRRFGFGSTDFTHFVGLYWNYDDFISANPTWTEDEFALLVEENYDTIKNDDGT